MFETIMLHFDIPNTPYTLLRRRICSEETTPRACYALSTRRTYAEGHRRVNFPRRDICGVHGRLALISRDRQPVMSSA
jgi:hypothetical protein